MKVKKIEIIHHDFFGNTELSFMNAQGEIMDNIIVAGENGCGKTQLLNLIYDFSTLSVSDVGHNEKYIFTVVLSEAELIKIDQAMQEGHKLESPTGEFIITKDLQKPRNDWNRFTVNYQSRSVDGTVQIKTFHRPFALLGNEVVKNIFASLFSTVEINYSPKDTSNVTSKDIDENIMTSVKSDLDLATEIQQLLIDIQDNDAHELQAWVDEHPGIAPPQNVINKRITRFKNAFSQVFANLNFSRVATENGKKKVYFKKNEQDVNIGSLSSGEKQIVFRGAFLLRNQQSSKGSIVLIDEPEISLHPIWQEKILTYYKSLFIDSSGEQTSQIFIATHSQYVLQSALENPDNTLILLLKNNSGAVECKSITAPLVLPSITSAELNYVAFGLVSNDYHIELYGFLQNKVTASSIKACDDYIVSQTPLYDANRHERISSHKTTTYQTLPTFIRNAIDHPDPTRTFTREQLRTSIELLIELCR